MSLEAIKLTLSSGNYQEVLTDAVDQINSSTSELKVRGINSPAYVLLGGQAFVGQVLVELFRQNSALLALNLAGATQTERQAAQSATGTVMLTSAIRQVASEVTVTSPSGVTYLQDQPPTLLLPGLASEVKFRAVQVGAAGNSASSSDLFSDGWGISLELTEGTTVGFAGGRLAESDEDLLERASIALSGSVPISLSDWVRLAESELRRISPDSQPIVWAELSSERFPLLSVPGTGCENFYSRPAVKLRIARLPGQTATGAERLQLAEALSSRQLLHVVVDISLLPIVPCRARVIVSVDQPNLDKITDDINQQLLGLFSAAPDGLVEHRKLLSAVARVPGVVVAEEVWLNIAMEPQLKPDNLKTDGLPFLRELEVKLVTASGVVDQSRSNV